MSLLTVVSMLASMVDCHCSSGLLCHVLDLRLGLLVCWPLSCLIMVCTGRCPTSDTLLLLALCILIDAHLAHELLLLKSKLLFPVLDGHTHLVLINDHLCDALVPLAGHRVRRELLLVNFSPLDDLAEAATHIVELKVGPGLRARVLVVRVIVEVDSLVVHQVATFIFSVRVVRHVLSLLSRSSLLLLSLK